MPTLFKTSPCLSGMCIKDQIVSAMVTARLASEEADQWQWHRRTEELLAEYMRLNDVQKTHERVKEG